MSSLGKSIMNPTIKYVSRADSNKATVALEIEIAIIHIQSIPIV